MTLNGQGRRFCFAGECVSKASGLRVPGSNGLHSGSKLFTTNFVKYATYFFISISIFQVLNNSVHMLISLSSLCNNVQDLILIKYKPYCKRGLVITSAKLNKDETFCSLNY